jgi:hypothetical protein
MPAERVLAEFDDLYQIGHSRLRVRVVQFGATGEPRLDIREYVESPRFTGWTRRGIRLDAEMVDQLKGMLADISRQLECSTAGGRGQRSVRRTAKRGGHDEC